jgi:RNA polymerase sigma-70 factor (ECF subfamily)
MTRGDDHALLRAVREGDARAVAHVVAAHGPAVYGLLRRMLRGDAAVDDLFQDVFLTFARRATELAPDTNLHAWLLVVAANRWRSYQRWRLVDPTRWLVLDVHDAPYDAPDEALDPASTLEQRDAVARLERTLAELDPSDRLVIVLHLDDALTSADRAAAIGVSETAYRKRLERARHRLTAALDAQHGRASSTRE